MASRVVLHIGTPKTGTSMVQDLLLRNSASLRTHDILVPSGAFDHQYRAGLDLLGDAAADSAGAWDRLAASIRRHTGTAIVSNEILTRATPAQIERAASSLDAAEIDVVITVRDLGRQLASGWQEAVKHRARLPFAAFLRAVQAPNSARRVARGFWAVQDWPEAAARWSAITDPSRVHIVTVPPSSNDPAVLHGRVLDAMGIDPTWVPQPPERLNTRLGAAETKVLRGINRRNGPAGLDAASYAEFVRDRLVRGMAGRVARPLRIRTPPSAHEWTTSVSTRWVEDVRTKGYDVVGDLAELEPHTYDEWADPDAVPARRELASANAAIDVLLEELVAERNDNVDRFYEIARAYARQRAGRLRLVRMLLHAKSRLTRPPR